VSLPGTWRLGRLDENVAAADPELSDAGLREIEDPGVAPHRDGRWCPEAVERLIDR
jgi:aryl-alcohol dehydrogenase-like predicted oxidoreductase